jgi:hypothetical protein
VQPLVKVPRVLPPGCNVRKPEGCNVRIQGP